MIKLPPDWSEVDVSDNPDDVEFMVRGPVTEYGYAPTVIAKRLPRLDEGIEVGMAMLLDPGLREDPSHRLIDVGEVMLAGYRAAVAVLTYNSRDRNITQILYYITPKELPTAYLLALMSATPDFGPMAGAFADIVASFQPKGH